MRTNRLLALLCILALCLGIAACSGPDAEGQILKVHFIDVGQADAILIQGPEGENIVIDAGNNNDSETVVSYIRKQGVKELKAVIGTHPHEDH